MWSPAGTIWGGITMEIAEEHIYFKVHPEVERYFSEEKEDRGHMDPGVPYRIKTMLSEGEYVISNVVYGLENRIAGFVEHVYTG